MHKKITAVALSAILVLSLVGCNKSDDESPLAAMSKAELIEYAATLENNASALIEENGRLQEVITGIQGETVEVPVVSEFKDNSGRRTLNSVDDVVKLPHELTYPMSTQTFASGSLSVSENLKFKPSSNWVFKMDGTTTELEHTGAGISGKIVVGKIVVPPNEDAVKPDGLKDYINQFFSDPMPPANVGYTRIYLDQNWVGLDAQAHTFIDEQDAQLRCGMMGIGENSIIYLFAYRGEQDSTKDEMILNLLQGATYNGLSFRIE